MKKILIICTIIFWLPACTWVELTLSGEKVRILSAQEVEGCERIGTTTVSLKAEVGGIKRKPLKVQQELNTLARNGAADLHGDAAVAITSPQDGRQAFAVYRCNKP